jgi:hypothetical protein
MVLPDAETPLEPDFRVLSFQPQQGHGVARRYQKRKTHHKSRLGCISCKVKRVKVRLAHIPPILAIGYRTDTQV